VLAGASLGEERVERVIAASDGLVRRHLAVRLDAVLETKVIFKQTFKNVYTANNIYIYNKCLERYYSPPSNRAPSRRCPFGSQLDRRARKYIPSAMKKRRFIYKLFIVTQFHRFYIMPAKR
jgi:hypothetical protein